MSRKKREYVISSWKGIDYIKANADKVNHTPASIQSYSMFGLASNRSKIARQLLHTVLPQPNSIAIRQRLQNAFSKWLQTGQFRNVEPMDDIPFFDGLSLNEKKELKQFLRFPILIGRTVDGNLLLHLPGFDPVEQIKAPGGTRLLYLKIAVAALNIEHPGEQEAFETELAVPYISGIFPAQDIALQLATMHGPACIGNHRPAIFYGQYNGANSKPVTLETRRHCRKFL